MLQEVRVARTGSQILFGFLLSVVFMPRERHDRRAGPPVAEAPTARHRPKTDGCR
ncbi:DUF6328 family protein [Kitasatospora sp. NPDC058190]|uniref:DUF6328 family protein n=1 Tax=Kitasatospora sp. NPDC058190 TaxID=3346371 RepID=UPI0036DBCC77